MAIAQLTSRIDAVKVYAAGATVTRIADLPLTPGQLPEQVEMAGLPLALDDSSVRVRVDLDGGNAPIASDVRIGLAVPPPSETPNPPLDEELRAADAEVKRIQDLIALIDNEIAVLSHLEVPDRPQSELGIAPPPSPMSARLALANFSDEQIRLRMQEKREMAEKLRQAEENLADLQQKQRLASTANQVKPNELRKTVIVSLSYEGESQTERVSRLVLEYFVPGARWTPTYVCRLNSVESSATIAVRALICQSTGEDWSGVRLELSTAMPMSWCALPELPSLRLGKAQPVPRMTGWRKSPIGAEILFEDYDRQKKAALAGVSTQSAIANLFSPSVPPLPQIPTSLELFGAGVSGDLADLYEEPLDRVDVFGDLAAELSDEVEFREAPITFSAYADRGQLQALSAAPPRYIKKSGSNLGFDLVEREEELRLAYGLMRLGATNDRAKRGKLSIEQRHEVYLEILQRQKVVVNFNVTAIVQQAITQAEESLFVELPPGGISVREVAGSFDYAYSAEGRIDVPSDGQFHSVALTSKSTDVDVRYVVVPREDTNVFRIAQLRNPLQAPLLRGAADIYVDGEYILSTHIVTVPPKGQMELGLGVEQAIKVARNTFYEEVRSGETIVAFNELRHRIQVDIINHLPREARIEVRERLPIPEEGAKVDVQIERVSPAWEKYEQDERGAPIRGGYRWQVQIPPREQATLSVDYKIKTFVDSELIGGNHRE